MKKLISISYVLIAFIFLSQKLFSQSNQTDSTIHPRLVSDKSERVGKIIVTIVGFENNEGDCRFALNNSEELHEREDTVFIGLVLPIKNDTVVVEFDSLNYGWYAIKVLHDENQNSELDTDFLGIPSERYGYSNNASGWFGPPSWEKAKFLLNQEVMKIEIEVD